MNKRAVLHLIRTKAESLRLDGKTEFAEVLDNMAETIEEMPDPEKATREKVYTQIHKDSPITYPTWKCGHCGFEDRYRGDFCRMCGRKFDDD